ncbi:MAG: amidohydrolase family protein [Roseivirga sp.]|nr:amidohydrolase family protein [Roseivirga sp.]
MTIAKYYLICLCFIFFLSCKNDETPDPGPDQDPEVILIDSPEEITGGSFAIINVNVVPMTADRVLENHMVLIENNVISGLGIQGTISIPDGMEVIDADGKGYLIPGLMDMHYHRSTGLDLFLFAANGVTTVREMWGSTGLVALRDRILAENLDAPQVFVASPGMNGANGAFEQFTPPVITVEEARELVRQYKAEGFDFIKAYNKLEPEVYEAIITEAALQDIPVVGHVPRLVGPRRVFQSGQTSTEHFIGFGLYASSQGTMSRGTLNAERVDELIDLSLNNGNLWHVPTIMVDVLSTADVTRIKASPEYQVISQVLRDNFESGFAQGTTTSVESEINHKQVLKAIFDKGGKIMLGTDAGFGFVIPGYSIHEELNYTVEAGLGNYEALKTATVNPATYLKVIDNVGTIEVGKRADLVLLESNPLENIGATKDRAGVVLRGKWISEQAIRDFLAGG